mgnify:CR=1 FL=1
MLQAFDALVGKREELTFEEDGHGDQCSICVDGYMVPSKSMLMSCEAKSVRGKKMKKSTVNTCDDFPLLSTDTSASTTRGTKGR